MAPKRDASRVDAGEKMSGLPEKQRRLYEILKRAAANKEKCPTNSVLCELLGYGSVSGPIWVMERLISRGLISVQRNNHCRVVSIIDNGMKTAGVVEGQHHAAKPGYVRPTVKSGRRVPTVRKNSSFDRDAAEFYKIAPYSEPCFYCGAARGCGHRDGVA